MLSLSHLALTSFTSSSGTHCYDLHMSFVLFLLIQGQYCTDAAIEYSLAVQYSINGLFDLLYVLYLSLLLLSYVST